ncbi:MAG: RNA polymerase sigma factor [Myxococcota bacterium]
MPPEADDNRRARLRRERALVARAQGGDRDAFGALYRLHAPELFARVLLPRLGSRSAAEDALAETFRKALEQLPRWKPHADGLRPWLSRIAANEATNMHRVSARSGRALASFEGLLGPLRESADLPGAALDARERQARLRARLDAVLPRLSPRYRRAIELRLVEERNREACAEALDVKLGTFDVVLLRALRAFRREWERLGDATPLPGGAPRARSQEETP